MKTRVGQCDAIGSGGGGGGSDEKNIQHCLACSGGKVGSHCERLTNMEQINQHNKACCVRYGLIQYSVRWTKA